MGIGLTGGCDTLSGMTYAPASLLTLRVYLASKTGLPNVSLGIVGDSSRHVRGYHLGRDRIYSANGSGDADYSVRTDRDRSGLSNAASAIDIGNFKQLRAMSVWLVERARSNTPDTHDIREIIYSPDGVRVLRWDRERGVSSAPRTGEADNSHLTHTHISWYRDSETRDKTSAFKAYFEGEDMLAIVTRQPFKEPITFITRPGTRLIGYDPARPNTLVVDLTWNSASSARASATVSVAWEGTTNPPVPRGGPFLEVVDGRYAGLLIVAALVDWIMPPDVSDRYNEGFNEGLKASSGVVIASAQTIESLRRV